MGSDGKKKKIRVEEFEKENLYHDFTPAKKEKLGLKEYEEILLEKEIELVKLQEWVKAIKLKVVVIIMQTISRTHRNIIMGIPISIIQRGDARIM